MNEQTRPHSRSFRQSEASQIAAWVGKLDSHYIQLQYAPLYICSQGCDGGMTSANVRLGPSELRALAAELVDAAAFLENNKPAEQ